MAGFSFRARRRYSALTSTLASGFQHLLGDGARRNILPVAQIDLKHAALDRLANDRIGEDLAVDAKLNLAADARP
jgi:hypothetical protein